MARLRRRRNLRLSTSKSKKKVLLIDAAVSMRNGARDGIGNLMNTLDDYQAKNRWFDFLGDIITCGRVNDNGCLVLNYNIDLRGYPMFTYNGRKWGFHQIAYAAFAGLTEQRAVDLFFGPRGTNPKVLHVCPNNADERACGNPFHVKLEEHHHENTDHRRKGGRHTSRKIDKHNHFVMMALLEKGWDVNEVARIINVDPMTVNRYRNGRFRGFVRDILEFFRLQGRLNLPTEPPSERR